MKYLLLTFLFTLLNIGFSQTLGELSKAADGYKKDVKALVIGISDYQNIRSLNYAHRDAEEFAKFLQDNPFWKVNEGNIFLFTNENARQGDILMGLQWLMETTTADQEVIFYFSGHGDVENIEGEDQGFLLAYDAPKNNYPMGGTIAVSMLDSAFTELIKRNVKINIIVDACKSGQLAGGMTGTGHTNETLAAKWTSQTRILSAQPNQLSLEDEKWGNGRGVFSYFLIRGMSGYANADSDELIRLNEIENYLGENLAKQTLGAQQPIVDGPNKWTKNFSVKDTSQMALYADDEIEYELTNLVASTKAGEDQVTESCQSLYGATRDKIKALDRDAFSGIRADYSNLMACSGGQYASLRYEYMRQLINQINQIVQETLSGKKLGLANDFVYGVELIDELLRINEGKKLIGKQHFENLYSFFKAMNYMYGEEALWTEHQFLVTFNGFTWDVNDLRTKAYNTNSSDGLIGFIFDGPSEITEIEKGLKKQVVQWTATEYDTYQFLKSVDDRLWGAVDVSLIFFNDTIPWLKKEEAGKVERLIPRNKQEGYYEQMLLDELKIAVDKEPDAAYLKYPLSYLYTALGNREKSYELLLKAIDQSPKWLTPKYVLATMYHNDKKYELARKYYEEVLALDTIYQDFECLDCFYMGLISLYHQTEDVEQMNETVQLWNSQKKVREFDLYNLLLYYSFERGDRKGTQQWIDQMYETTGGSFEEQMEIMTCELYLFKSDKKFLESIRRLMADLMIHRVDGTLEELLSAEESVVMRLRMDEIFYAYFPPRARIPYDAQDTLSLEDFHNYNFLYDVSRVFSALTTTKKSSPDDVYFQFFAEGAIKYDHLQNFLDWLNTFEYIDDTDLISENWEMDKETYYDAETAFYENFISGRGIFYDGLDECFTAKDWGDTENLTIRLLEGENIVDQPFFKDFISRNTKTFEDQQIAEEIIQKLKRYEKNKRAEVLASTFEVQMKAMADQIDHFGTSNGYLKAMRDMLKDLVMLRKDFMLDKFLEEQDDYTSVRRNVGDGMILEFFDDKDQIIYANKDSVDFMKFRSGPFLEAVAEVYEKVAQKENSIPEDALFNYLLRGCTMFSDLDAFESWLEAYRSVDERYDLKERWSYFHEDYFSEKREFQILFVGGRKSDLLITDYFEYEDIFETERITVMLLEGQDVAADETVNAFLEAHSNTPEDQVQVRRIRMELERLQNP